MFGNNKTRIILIALLVVVFLGWLVWALTNEGGQPFSPASRLGLAALPTATSKPLATKVPTATTKPPIANTLKPTSTPGVTATSTPAPTATATATSTLPVTNTPQPTETPAATVMPTPTVTLASTVTPGSATTPFPSAPLCPDSGEGHDYSLFHTLWDSARGCHWDHEHGEDPFIPAVAEAFPGLDLFGLLGGVQIGHTNPSSPVENTHKHGGFKWQVSVPAPQGCVTGFEGAAYGVDAAVVQYHAFGDYAVEFEARIHSTAALVRHCVPGSTDYGYIYTVQHQEYGQRVTPYQGTILPYPNTPNPAYGATFGPYLTVDCIGTGLPNCRSSRDFILSRNLNANSIWTSKPTGSGERPATSSLFRLLFRVRDTFQVLDSADTVHPFTYNWLCSNDGGATYSTNVGCRYNNTTTRVHEVAGDIPAAWDNLAGFDTDARIGRISAEGYTNGFGTLDLACSAPTTSCFPLVLVNAYVGRWGGELSATKVSNPDPTSNPDREIFWCNGLVCGETDAGAQASGWVGQEN